MAATDFGGAVGDRRLSLPAQSCGRGRNACHADECLLHDRGNFQNRLLLDHSSIAQLGLDSGKRCSRDPDRHVASLQSRHEPVVARCPNRGPTDLGRNRHRHDGLDGEEGNELTPAGRPESAGPYCAGEDPRWLWPLILVRCPTPHAGAVPWPVPRRRCRCRGYTNGRGEAKT